MHFAKTDVLKFSEMDTPLWFFFWGPFNRVWPGCFLDNIGNTRRFATPLFYVTLALRLIAWTSTHKHGGGP